MMVSRMSKAYTILPVSAYLDPSFEAMVRCQLKFAEEGYSKLAGVQR